MSVRRGAAAAAAAGLLAAAAPGDGLARSVSAAACERIVFREVAAEVGLDFVHDRGATGDYHIAETIGSGLAWLDYDGDGWLDLYVVQSGPFPPDGSEAAANRLFRNDGAGGFVEVPDAAGAGDRGYGQGVVAADLDGDGRDDLVVTNFGPDRIYLNRDGRFDARALDTPSRVDDWSTSASLADVDGDGDLDLYVARYLRYDPASNPFCRGGDGGRDYCDPDLYEAPADTLYLNDGDGGFTDATAAAGLDVVPGKGLGVLMADLDGDHDIDIYVANDATMNFLFANRGDGTFEDVSLLSGTALSDSGQAQAGMGVALGDVDDDGLPEVAVTNFDVEMNALYRNLGGLQFYDGAAAGGFGLASHNLLGFGVLLTDLDGDLNTDAYVVNGHVVERPDREGVGYAQPDLLLLGDGAGGFERLECGEATGAPHVGRGLAAADYDADGDLDLAISGSGEPLRLLRNESAPRRWLGLELVAAGDNRQAVGARIRLETSTGEHEEWLLRGASYLSSGDPRVLFGLPEPLTGDELLRIVWPDGAITHHSVEPAMVGSYTRLVQP